MHISLYFGLRFNYTYDILCISFFLVISLFLAFCPKNNCYFLFFLLKIVILLIIWGHVRNVISNIVNIFFYVRCHLVIKCMLRDIHIVIVLILLTIRTVLKSFCYFCHKTIVVYFVIVNNISGLWSLF